MFSECEKVLNEIIVCFSMINFSLVLVKVDIFDFYGDCIFY